MLFIIANAPISEEDKKLVTQLFLKYNRLMLCIANSILSNHASAEDAVSESLVKIIRYRDKLRNAECHQTKKYIVNIVRTTSFNIIKQRGILKYETDDLSEDISDESISIEEEIISNESCDSIMDAFRKLPEKLKDVAYEFFVFERSHEEIAKMLGITVSASKKRLSRARTMIKKILAGDKNGK